MRDGMALCRKWGFYRGDLAADPGSWALCSTCRKLREREIAKAAKETDRG